MKNLKKLTKTVTAVILGAALLTGCGSKENVKTANAQAPAENQNAAGSTASAESPSLEAASLEEEKNEEAGVTEPVTVKLGVVGENNEQWEPIIAPLGLYSDKISDVSELKEGDKIAIPSDATNGGRALKVLEAAGVIKVDPKAGYTPVLSDITDNPLNLEFIEVEAANTPSLLLDVAAAIINGGHAVDNGLFPEEDAIYLETVQEGSDNPYINIVVARTADKDNGIYKRVVEEYRTEAVAKVIEEVYKGAYIPTWE